MAEDETCVLSIAGFDPSGGAGILADIKTFEAHKVYGMGAVSALTFQNDTEFEGVRWLEAFDILKQIFTLQRRFRFKVIKIGLIKDQETLDTVVTVLKSRIQDLQLIWDPIIKASAGFEFHKNIDKEKLYSILKKIYLVTPNSEEAKFLTGKDDSVDAAKEMSSHCNVLLKGGHSQEAPGVDYLFIKNEIVAIHPSEIMVHPKHGSGCVLSSAIAAELTKSNNLIFSCRKAKQYVERFLASNHFLLGTHYV